MIEKELVHNVVEALNLMDHRFDTTINSQTNQTAILNDLTVLVNEGFQNVFGAIIEVAKMLQALAQKQDELRQAVVLGANDEPPMIAEAVPVELTPGEEFANKVLMSPAVEGILLGLTASEVATLADQIAFRYDLDVVDPFDPHEASD